MNRRHPDRHPLGHDPARSKGRVRGVLSAALVAVLLALATFVAGAGSVSADDQPTMKVDPATQTVAPGQEFVVNVIQSATVATTGAQVNVTFDPKLLQMKDFELGTAYTSASAVFAFGNVDMGTTGNKDATITRANKFGTLESAAGFLLPGSGTIPAGDTVFLKITFVARAGQKGQMNLGLGHASMIGGTGDALAPHVLNGVVIVGQGVPGGSSSPGSSPLASASETASPSAAQTEAPASPVSPTTAVKVSVDPTSITLQAGMPARVFLIAASDGDISSVAADLSFDKDKLEITGLEEAPGWGSAIVLAGVSSQGVAAAIAEANTTGVLRQAGAFFPPGTQELPYGEGVFVSVLVSAKADGTSRLSVANAVVLGVAGENIPVTIDAGDLTAPPPKAIEFDPVLVGLILLILVLVIGGVVIGRSGRIPVRVRRRWPFYVSLILGLIPVLLFLLLVLTLLINSAPVVNSPGIAALFGSQYSSKYTGGNIGLFGLLPALWGSFLIAFVAVVVALPIALALAIVAVDFPMGPITRLVRPIVGILSGIPPIVYAVSVPIFITLFMIPKFAANATSSTFSAAAIGADPSTWPPPDVPFSAGALPWDLTGVANSTLLGGILIALFLIPFVTPLFVDALRDVPRAAREASLALGANRTYTLRRIVLPRALPAMTGASMLAVLKALGDTLIVAFAVGWSADNLPQPLFDVLERTASLGAQGAGLIGSFETLDAQCTAEECAVGYSGALLLLLLAGVVVIFVTWLQARGRRRVAV